MQKGVEAMSQLIVSRGETAELFESIEESFDEIFRLVTMPVDFALREPIASRRDDGLSARGFDGFNQYIAVVSLVSHNCFGRDGCHEGGPLRDISELSAGEDQSDRIAQRIDRHMDLCGQPAPRSADRLISTVFLTRRRHVGGRERRSSQ